MGALYFFCQFWGLFFLCCGVPNSQKKWLSSLTPTIVPLSSSSNIPWLVSMAENCQGFILSQWWILSTVSCLNKLKAFHADISGVINQESILLGHKICIHPGFNSNDGKESVKGDIGMVLLQYPIMREENPLSHTYTIFWKSCYNCLYRHCRVYQYEKHNNFGTNIRKLSLDLLFCHHQHINMAKNNNLCIWSQPQEDCLLQQGSPVLCHFGIHWELVGLVSESSIICYDPILVINTAPYLAWVRLFIKAYQKPLYPVLSLLCSFFPESEHDLQDKFSTNKGSAVLPSHGFSVKSQRRRLGTFPLDRQRRNPPLAFFDSKRNSFLDSIQLYLQSIQLSFSSKFPMTETWISPISKMWDSYIADPGYTQVPDTFESLIISEPHSSKRADLIIPWEIDHMDAMKYQYETLTDLGYKLLDDVTARNTLPLSDAGRSWIPYSSDIDGYQVLSKINAANTYVKSSMFPIHGQFVARPWLEIISDFGPGKTERVTRNQYSKNSIRTQIYHVPETINTGANPEKYNTQSLVSLLINTNELQTYPFLNEDGSQYLTVTQTFEPWYQSSLYIFGSQEPIEKTIRYWANPESKSTYFEDNTVRYLTLYKTSQIGSSRKMDGILEHLLHTIGKTLLFIRPITNTIGPFIHSKVVGNRPWNYPESDTIHSVTHSGQVLTQLKADIITLWLQTKIEKIRPWSQPYFKISTSTTGLEEGKNKHTKATTIKLWTQTEIETVIPWNQPESDTVRSQNEPMKLRIQPDFKTLQSWTLPDIDIVRPWIQYNIGSIQSWRTPETFTFGPWTQSKVNRVTPKTKLGLWSEVSVRVWFQSQTNTIRTWKQSESQTNGVQSWYHTQMDTLKTWLEMEFQKVYPLTQPEDAIPRTWSQTQNINVKVWSQAPWETVTQWMVIQTEHNWRHTETEIVRPWNQPVTEKLKTWIQQKGYSIWSSNKLEGEKLRLWSQSEDEVLRPLFHTDVHIIQNWIENKSSSLTGGSQSEYPEENFWRQSETDSVMLWTQYVTPIANYWSGVLSGIVIPWIKTEFQGLKSQIQSNSDKVTMGTQAETPVLKALILSETGTFKTRPPYEIFSEWVVYDHPVLHQWTQTVDAVEELQSEDELPALSTLTGSIVHSVTSWIEGKPPAIILWTQPMSHKIVPWTLVVYKIGKPWSEAIVPTVTKWLMDDSPLVNLWEKTVSDKIISSLPKDEYPARDSWSLPLSISPWSQDPLVNTWTKPVADTITPPWPLDKYPTENLLPLALSDTIILPWLQAKYSPVIQVAQPVSDTITLLWAHVESSPEYLWIQSISNILTPLWPQDETSTGSSWPETWFDSVILPWPHTESPPVKLWTLLESSTITLPLPQLETSGINLWTLLVSDISIPIWPQIEYKPENVWTQSLLDRIMTPWPQAEYLPVNQWPLIFSDEIISHWLQDESPPVHLFKTVSDIIIPLWPQDKSSSRFFEPWIFSKTVTSSDFQDKWPAKNLWTQFVSYTIVPPGPKVEFIPANIWTLPLSDTTMTRGPQADYIPVNQWTLFISDEIISHWLQDESSSVNLFKTSVSATITPHWPQDESSSRYLWTWTFSKTVTSSQFQNKFPAINQWTHLVSDTIVSPWPQGDYIPANVWTLPLSDTTITQGPQADYISLNQWTLFISDEIISHWLQDESSSVNLFKTSVSDATTRLWPQDESSPGYLWPWAFSKIITTSEFQDELPTANQWKNLVSDTVISSRPQVNYKPKTVWTLSDSTKAMWLQGEYPPINEWTVFISDEIKPHWMEDESSPVNLFKLSVSDTTSPLWPLDESLLGYLWPWTFSKTVTTSKFQDESPTISLWKQHISEIILPPPSQVQYPLTTVWTLPLLDTILPPWPQVEYPIVSLWILQASDTIISSWPQTEFPPGIVLTLSLSDTTTPVWPQAEFPAETLWPHTLYEIFTASKPQTHEFQANKLTLLLHDTITSSWLQAEHPAGNLWTLPVADTITPLWPQTDYPPFSLWAMLPFDTATQPGSQDESSSLILWTMPISHTIAQNWTQTESPHVNMWTLSLSYTMTASWPQVEFPGILWPKTLSDTISISRAQAESRANLWTLLVSDTIILPWPKVSEDPPINLWTLPVSDTITSLWLQTEYPPVSLRTLLVLNTITPLWSQTESPIVNLWSQLFSKKFSATKIEAESSPINLSPVHASVTIILPQPEAESSAGDILAQLVSDAVISLWPQAESKVEYTLAQPVSNIPTSLWTQDESTVGYLLPMLLNNTITPLWPQDKSLTIKLWAKNVSDTVILPWLHAKSVAGNWQPQFLSAISIPPWPHNESSLVNLWTQPVSDTTMSPWLEKESSARTLWSESKINTVTLQWPRPESLPVNIQPESVYVATPLWIQAEYPAVHPWTYFVSDRIISAWLHAESSIVSLWILTLSATDTPTWIQAETPAVNLWPKSFPDRVTPLWLQTESPLVNLWAGLVSNMITSPWPLTGFRTINTSTLSVSETITPPWLQNESPPENLWTLPLSNIIKPPWLQAESSTANPRLPLISETNISSQSQSENPVSILLTEFTSDIFRPLTQSKFLTMEPGIQSFSDTLPLWFQAESPSVRHWTQAISDAFALWNQATSPIIYLWTRYEIDTFKKWSNSQFPRVKLPTQPITDILNDAKTETSIPWTKLETNIVAHLTQAISEIINSKIHNIDDRMSPTGHIFSLNSRTQFESDTIRMGIQTQSPTLIPWSQTENDTITSLTQALRPSVNALTVFVTGTDILWNTAEVISLKGWKKLTTEKVTQWTQNKSTVMNAVIQPMSNTVTLFTQAISSIENHWTQLEAHKVTPQTHIKSLKKYALTEADSETITPWNPGEFSEIKTLSGTDALTLWQQTVSKTVILQIGTIAKTGKLWTQGQSLAFNPWTQFVVNTTMWIQTKVQARNSWVQPLSNKITLRTQTKSPLVNSWSQKEKTAVNPRILLESPIVNIHTESETLVLTPWSKYKSGTITPGAYTDHLTKSTIETVILCTQSESTTFKSFIQKDNKVIACSETEISRTYPWKRSKLPKIISWIQAESPLLNHWAEPKISKFIMWTQVESPSLNPLTGATGSKGISWTQAESPQIDSWEGTTVSKVISWFHTEDSPTNPWIAAIDSEVISWSGAEFPTTDPWIQPASSTVTYLAQEINSIVNTWAQTSPIISGTHSVSAAVITQIQPIVETLTALSQDESRILSPWTQSLSVKVTWTQIETKEIKAWSETKVSKVTPWVKTDSLSVNSITEIENDTGIFSGMRKGAKKSWMLMEVNTFRISMKPQTDATQHLNHVENHASVLHTYPEIEKSETWFLPEFGTLSSWIVSITQISRYSYQPESLISKDGIKIQTKSIKPWPQSDFETFSNFTSFSSSNVEPWVQPRPVIDMSRIQSETSIFAHLIQSEVDRIRFRTISEIDRVIPWIQNKPGTISPWTQIKMNASRTLTQDESLVLSLWTQTVPDIVTLLSQNEMQASKHLAMSDINNVIPLVQTQNDIIKQRTQIESQMITSWVQPEIQEGHPWNQPKIDVVRPWSQLEGYAVQPWTHTETNSAGLMTYSETDKIQFQTQPESQEVRIWPPADILTLWSLSQYDSIKSLSQVESQTLDSGEIDVSKIWTQNEAATINSWTLSDTTEILPETQTNRVTAYLFQSQKDPIRTPNQSESKAVQTWTETTFIKIDTTKPWTQTNTTKPWIQIDPPKMSSWTQNDVSTLRSWTQQTPASDTGTYPEIQAFTPWDKLQDDRDRSLFHVQMNKEISWTYSESQIFSPLTQSEVWMKRSWMQSETEAVKLWTQSETTIVRSPSQVVYEVAKQWTSFGGRTLKSSVYSETQLDMLSFSITNTDKDSTWVQPETKSVRPGKENKADVIESFASSEVESGEETLLTSNFGIWPKIVPFLPVETILSLDKEGNISLSTTIATLENQDKNNSLQTSHLTNIVLPTLSSSWLLGRLGYENVGSNVQITQTKGSLDVQATSTNSLSSPFISCSHPYSCALSSTCYFFSSCILPSSCISPFCSFSSSMTTSLPLPTIFSDSLQQNLSSSKFTEETTVSQNFSSLHATPATLLTKSPLVPIYFEPTSKSQPVQLPLSHSEFNISLAECRLGVIWRDDLQALWLFKTAIASHEITECGLRHGLVPQCPNCWEAEIGEFPWMVSVQLSFSHFCAGSILNKQWILTSARCAHFIKNSEALALVQVGLIDLQDPAQAQTVGIHHAMPYLGPKGPLGPGLIFLKEPLTFQPMALPICLEESLEQERNIQLYDCWLPSWSLMRGSPGILQKRHLSILKVSTCTQFWPKLNEFTFCVEAKKAMGEAGCKGDLGAPLVCHLQQKNTWVQVGILSHFDERCTKPYVFSQVSPFIFWLQGVTRPSHAPWSQQGPMTTSASISISVSTTRNASVFTSTTASVQPNFISLPQPQTLADRISLRYTMPWQAIIINCGSQICSGSIISNSWVLTAAHCVRNMNPEDTVVILGLRYPGAPLRVIKVSNILLHERFRLVSGVARNDIALLLLQGTPTSIPTLAPLGHVKNLNSSECWLSGPRILKPGETDEHPEILQMHMMQASNCVYLYPDLGSSIVCFYTQSKSSDINVDPVSAGSAVMCRPIPGGKWKQIGLTSLKSLATIVSPHFSWILTTSAKTGHPLSQEIIPLAEKPKSSCPLKSTNALPLFLIMIIVVQSVFTVQKLE